MRGLGVRVIVVLVASVAAAACGGSSGDEQADGLSPASTSSPPADDAGGRDEGDADVAAATADLSEIDTWDCDFFAGIIEDLVGPADRTEKPFDAGWFEGDTTLRAGCGFTGSDAVSIEVHVVDDDRHSIPFMWLRPALAAERDAGQLGIGDESYGDENTVVARKGFVEVSVDRPFNLSDELAGVEHDLMAVDDMKQVAERLLEPFPSGPGPTVDHGRPPDVPIPPGADPRDWSYASFQDMIGGVEGVPYDPEVTPDFWSLLLTADAVSVGAFCDELRGLGLDESAAAAFFEADEEAWACSGRLDDHVIGVFDPAVMGGSGEDSGMWVFEWSAVRRAMLVCEDEPARCESDS